MYKIYGPKQSSASRCIWVAEELGVAYESVPVNMKEKEHKSPEFLKLNPNGKIPVLVDGDFVLWESFAICKYLIEKAGSDLAGAGAEEHALVEQWTLWTMLHPYQLIEKIMSYKWRGIPEDDAAADARAKLPQWLEILDGALEGKNYLVAERFTLADLMLASVIMYADRAEIDMSAYANIVDWKARVMARPALAVFATP